MVTRKLNEKKSILVKNVYGCTNFGGLDILGNMMFTIKTRPDNQLSTISVYPNFKKTKRYNYKYAGCMYHGNDLTYNNGLLYVAPCDNFVEVVNTGDWSHYRLYSDIHVSAIAHYQANQFIVLCGNGGNFYQLAIMEPRGNKMEALSIWNVNNPKSPLFTISQGMTFNKRNGKIYVVFTKNDKHRNVILVSGVGVPDPELCLTSKKSSGKYELEGVAVNSAGKLVIGSNLPSGKDATFIASA